MAYNFPGMPAAAIPSMGIGTIGPLPGISATQNFIELTAAQRFPPLPPSIALPGMNDAPLEFATNKNQPPVVRETINESMDSERRSDKFDNRRDRDSRDSRDRRPRDRTDRRDRDRDRDRRDEKNDRDKREDRRSEGNGNNQSNINGSAILQTPNPPTNNTQTVGPPIEQPQSVWSMGISYQMMGLGHMGSLMGEIPIGPHLAHPHGFGPTMTMNMIAPEGAMLNAPLMAPDPIISDASQLIAGKIANTANQSTKEVIHCKNCTLFPPNPNAPPPTTRERPPGCRTVFVGGLPENITEGMIREVFERCGEISTLRLSKKNFCHIRFASESSVDAAIYLSGYRVRIGPNNDPTNTGRLHVDFAQARDDQYEWECKQRQYQREQRHRERVEKERQRPPISPPPVIHYTDHEASNICEKIKQDDSFMKAVQTLITWLERGDCTKRNANTFYSMIQSTNSHVRRLMSEKTMYEDELQRARELLKGRMQGLLIQFSQIERVFAAASHKKVWDHFTKAQRKNIETWKKQSLDVKTVQMEESNLDDLMEMDLSDEDEPHRKKSRSNSNEYIEKVQSLKDENDSLRCQLEAYKNEVDLLKNESKTDVEAKEKQVKMLQQTLKGMHEQLIQSKKQQLESRQKIKDLLKTANGSKNDNVDDEVITLDKDDSDEEDTSKTIVSPTISLQISQIDAKLLGLIAIFLHIHPFGASLDYIYYYLQKLVAGLRLNELESLMQRFPQVFKQEVSGIGANMERRWRFSGFNCNQNS